MLRTSMLTDPVDPLLTTPLGPPLRPIEEPKPAKRMKKLGRGFYHVDGLLGYMPMSSTAGIEDRGMLLRDDYGKREAVVASLAASSQGYDVLREAIRGASGMLASNAKLKSSLAVYDAAAVLRSEFMHLLSHKQLVPSQAAKLAELAELGLWKSPQIAKRAKTMKPKPVVHDDLLDSYLDATIAFRA